jgi:diguanylate cyclase (GGDEF)-like protein/PAS domain S-box-containing protein
VAATLAVIWLTAAYDLWHWREQRLQDARSSTASVAIAMDEFVKRIVQAVDMAMRGQAEAVARLGQPPEQAREEVAKLLAGGDAAFAKAFTLAVFDAKGFGVAASEPGLSASRNFADRDYFQVHLNNPHAGLYIGPPLLGRSFGKRFFSLSRRIESPDGRFLGVIMGSIDAQFLADYFATNASGPHGSITLAHIPSQTIVARSPDFTSSFASNVSKSPIFQHYLALTPNGSYFDSSVIDGKKRLFNYRSIDGLPLMVAASVAEEDILAEIKSALPGYLAALTALTLFVLAMARLLLATSRRLQEALQLKQNVIEMSPVGIALYSGEQGQCLTANPAFCRMIGASHAQLIAQNYRQLESWQQSGLLAAAQRVLRNGGTEHLDAHLHTTFGRELWLSCVLTTFDDPEGRRLLIMTDDRTAARQAEGRWQLASKVIENSNQAVLITDADNKIISVNPAFEKITGYSSADALGQDPKLLASGRHLKDFYQTMWHDLQAFDHWEGELWDRRKNGEIYPKWARMGTLRDPDSKRITNYVAIFSDITERKASEEKIHHLAHHDPLTHLPNRFAFSVHLKRALALARRENYRVGMIFIDLDHFKTINDSLGHHTGDLLLIEVGQRIRNAIRESDLVARLGGDEFVVVIEGVLRSEDISPITQKILDALAQPYAIESYQLTATPSIGVSIFPDDGDDADSLMKNADTAMYHAKNAGRNNVQFFAQHMNESAQARLLLENDLRTAIREQQFELYYQPQFDAAGKRLLGLEALIRWRHPQRGLVSPAEFIPVAEDTGLIVAIGEWVLGQACRQAKAWQQAGLEFGNVAVNISAQQLQRAGLVAAVEQALRDSDLAAAKLELEITETGVMTAAADAVLILETLKQLGVALAIDDFGTGYSSLAYLKRFPVDRLKIDRSFVMDIEKDASDAAIARSVIALAHALGLEVVAEGVESEGQAAFLRAHQCDRLQGYLYARPMPAEEVVKLMVRVDGAALV